MTVSELIAELQKQPQDAKVLMRYEHYARVEEPVVRCTSYGGRITVEIADEDYTEWQEEKE